MNLLSLRRCFDMLHFGAEDIVENGARRTEETYASPDVVARREQVLSMLAPQPGERVLDIRSGPGYLLASIAEAVGPTGAAHGVVRVRR